MKRNFCFCMLTILMLLGFTSNARSQFGDPVPKYAQEMDGVVNMANGRNLVFSETDISVPGRGVSLNFTRYYNGDALNRSTSEPSYMGPKWSHNYQWELKTTGRRPGTDYVGGFWVEGFWFVNEQGVEEWFPGFWLVEPTAVSRPNTLQFHVVNGSGSANTFTTSGTNLGYSGWEGRIKCEPQTGVRGSLKLAASGAKWAYLYTTRNGTVYRFEQPAGVSTSRNLLTKISDPNGNSLTLHYETPSSGARYPRLAAVEDMQGRILKFYYGVELNGAAYPRYISKVEFGLGTAQALTAAYQTINYSYSRSGSYNRLISAAQPLGAGDPRGSEIKAQYEYDGSTYYLNAVVSPLGERSEFELTGGAVDGVRVRDSAANNRTVLYHRYYSGASAYNTTAAHNSNNKRRHHTYTANSGHVTRLQSFYKKNNRAGQPVPASFEHRWYYGNRNVHIALHYDDADRKHKWCYMLSYEGSDSAHNRQMGNATKWEQIDCGRPFTSTTAVVFRKWEADYETTFNRPIWQIDSMGHRTEFTYDANGNLTEQRSKANTGAQPHAVDHDIVTTHEYDTYGNRTKTTFMPGTTQEKIVETVYDAAHHTYPIEVKTTVTVDGAGHTIKTKSEWDVNRGLKTADIDALGRRTEYAYWQDRRLKYTRRVADNMYAVPTYDKNGNVTQTQVRKDNWQTGALIAQTKTEYDGMGRVVKAHSFKDNWTTPYASTETVYDIYGDVSRTKDPRGLITEYTVDDLGRVTKQTLPDGDWVETRYNTLNQAAKAWTSQDGSEFSPAVSNTYDTFNRVSRVSYKTGETVSYTYDLGNNTLTQATNDGSQTYTYTYTHDQLNRVKNRTDSLLGYKTFYEYDDSSMRTRMRIQRSGGGANLYDVNYTYDEASRLISVTDALAAKTAGYAYFDIGALKTVTNPNGITAHRTLDDLNRLRTLTYKKTATDDLSSLTYTYDDKSNVTQLVRDDTGAGGGSSKTFTFGYDGISRLTSANYGNETVSYTYDKSGNRLTQVSSVDGTTAYTVAADSNQLTYRSLVPEDTDFSTMNYTYDAEGKLTQRSEGTDSDAFTYGFGSQLKQIQKTRNNTVTQTLSYAYDGGGKRVKVTDSRGTRYFLYDGMMPVLELDANKNITASYLYGADGVVYRRKYLQQSDAAAHWRFDEGAGITARDANGNHDGVLGNRKPEKMPAWSNERGGSLCFDGVDDFVIVQHHNDLNLAGGSLTLSCWVKRSAAASGYLIRKSDATDGYQFWINAAGSLQFDLLFNGAAKSITSAAAIPLNEWTHAAARYDGVELQVFINGVKESAGTPASGTLPATARVLFLGRYVYNQVEHHLNGCLDDVSIYSRALSDDEISELLAPESERYEYHHTNALGSNIVLTDDSKNVVARYEYDVFGAVRHEVGASDNPRKFTGKEYESDVKLYYYGARYYDPYIGRFTQRDPSKHGVNWYSYTYNNPMKYTDPTGKVPTKDQAGTVAGFLEEIFPKTPQGVKPNHPDLSDFKPRPRDGLNYRPAKKQLTKNRYIYTTKRGWIDMKHFLAAAATAVELRQRYKSKTLAYHYANALGYAAEVKQARSDKESERLSAFSYEDLSSNDAGASFGAMSYDPNSDLSLGEQIATWLNTQGAIANEKDAPNYDQLATSPANVTDEHVHKNYTGIPFIPEKPKQ